MALRRRSRLTAADKWARKIEKEITSQVALVTVNVQGSTYRFGVKHTPHEPNGLITRKALTRLKMVDADAQLGHVRLERKFVLLEFDEWGTKKTSERAAALEALKRAVAWMSPPADCEVDAEYTEDFEYISSVIAGLTTEKGNQGT